jgi:predicted GNAT family N-acyltransferase
MAERADELLKKRREAKRQRIIKETERLYLVALYSGSTRNFPTVVRQCMELRMKVLQNELGMPYRAERDALDFAREVFHVAAIQTSDNSIHIGTLRGRSVSPGAVELSNMCLLPEWRRRYIGQAMYVRFEQHCRQEIHAQRVVAQIPKICEGAEEFFLSLGFTKASDRIIKRGTLETVPCIEFTKPL